jgi:hypothetical protein
MMYTFTMFAWTRWRLPPFWSGLVSFCMSTPHSWFE